MIHEFFDLQKEIRFYLKEVIGIKNGDKVKLWIRYDVYAPKDVIVDSYMYPDLYLLINPNLLNLDNYVDDCMTAVRNYF